MVRLSLAPARSEHCIAPPDGGDWEPASGIPLNTGVQALTTHPGQPGTVFAATRAGMYKSTDTGASWKKLDVPSHNEEFWSVSIHPRKPDVVFAGVSSVGVYRSDNGGTNWRRVGSKDPMPELCDYSKAPKGVTSRLMRLCFDPTDPDLMFGACETNGLIVSEDGGETWRDASARPDRAVGKIREPQKRDHHAQPERRDPRRPCRGDDPGKAGRGVLCLPHGIVLLGRQGQVLAQLTKSAGLHRSTTAAICALPSMIRELLYRDEHRRAQQCGRVLSQLRCRAKPGSASTSR